MKQYHLLAFFISYLAIITNSLAQTDTSDRQALASAYKEIIPYPQEVSTGGQYEVGGTFHVDGTPFLVSKDYGYGQVVINGQAFDQVLLNFDVLRDQLLAYHPNTYKQMVLDNRKVSSFQLENGRKFILIPESFGYMWHQNGYYEVLWENKITIFSKHYKIEEIKKDYASEAKAFFYDTHEDFFIQQQGQITRIKSKKDIAETLDLPKRQVSQIIRKNNLRPKKQLREVLLKVADFYVTHTFKD